MLPNYTNVNVYDNAAREANITSEYRAKLLAREISEQSQQLAEIDGYLANARSELHRLVVSKMRISAFDVFLERIAVSRAINLDKTHLKKLTALYGGNILIKQPREPVINLSSHTICEPMKRILSLGMKCHLRTKYENIQRKIDVEKLFIFQ